MSRKKCRSCDGKIRHRNQAAAIVHQKRLKNAQIMPYHCGKCGGWHVGHSNDSWDVQARLDQLIGPVARPDAG